MRPSRARAAVVLFAAVLAVGCVTASSLPGATNPADAATRSTVSAQTTTTSAVGAAVSGEYVLLAAGDIAECSSTGDEVTANLLALSPGAAVVTLGDHAYSNGTAAEFASCYAPSWGRAKARTHPSPGNHDYNTANAAGYFGYFGAAAGSPTTGYYSFDWGSWHIISLNSNCSEVGGCQTGSAQERWLWADLAAHRRTCTLAYWHHPRFSSGEHGNDADVDGLWRALYAWRADVVLNGHDHDYERFALQSPDNVLDTVRGIREFVVGTGGAEKRVFKTIVPNSQLRVAGKNGILRLGLWPNSYTWMFIGDGGPAVHVDTGRSYCI